jgi:hypothetical protein
MKSPDKTPNAKASHPRKKKAPGPLRGIAVDPSLRGRGPAPGTGGRPRDEWKAWLRELVDSPLTRVSIETILQDPTHPAFPRVLQWADERGYGKEVTPIDATVSQLVVIRRDESAQGRGASA